MMMEDDMIIYKLMEAYSQTLCRNVGRNADEMR